MTGADHSVEVRLPRSRQELDTNLERSSHRPDRAEGDRVEVTTLDP